MDTTATPATTLSTTLGTPASTHWDADWLAEVDHVEAELGHRICGAHTPAWTPCKLTSTHPNGRCRFHGGAPGGNRNAWIHGLYSRRLQQCGDHCPLWNHCPMAGKDVLSLQPSERPHCVYEQEGFDATVLSFRSIGLRPMRADQLTTEREGDEITGVYATVNVDREDDRGDRSMLHRTETDATKPTLVEKKRRPFPSPAHPRPSRARRGPPHRRHPRAHPELPNALHQNRRASPGPTPHRPRTPPMAKTTPQLRRQSLVARASSPRPFEHTQRSRNPRPPHANAQSPRRNRRLPRSRPGTAPRTKIRLQPTPQKTETVRSSPRMIVDQVAAGVLARSPREAATVSFGPTFSFSEEKVGASAKPRRCR